MEFFETYEPEGFTDFLIGLFGFVPVGFMLGMFCGLLAFGIFGLVRLLKSMIR